MKTIVLENGFERDIPEELIRYLKSKKIEWEWFDMRQRFWPENRVETMKIFSEYPEGQEFICNTVFDGFQQLELMIELLYKLKSKKFTITIQHPCLPSNLLEYYEEKESGITPKELEDKLDAANSHEESKEAHNKIKAFKRSMNRKLREVLKFHNVYWLRVYESREAVRLSKLKDIKDNLSNY
jgi:hypothetical protein